MMIRDMFADDINRKINGVIKVDQAADDVIEQELNEYVITRELKKHFITFFNYYGDAFDQPTGRDCRVCALQRRRHIAVVGQPFHRHFYIRMNPVRAQERAEAVNPAELLAHTPQLCRVEYAHVVQASARQCRIAMHSVGPAQRRLARHKRMRLPLHRHFARAADYVYQFDLAMQMRYKRQRPCAHSL